MYLEMGIQRCKISLLIIGSAQTLTLLYKNLSLRNNLVIYVCVREQCEQMVYI